LGSSRFIRIDSLLTQHWLTSPIRSASLAPCHLLTARPLQPFQPVALLLAHSNSLHPSALRLSQGTFYFGVPLAGITLIAGPTVPLRDESSDPKQEIIARSNPDHDASEEM